MYVDRVSGLGFVFQIYLKGRSSMGLIFAILRFFRLPIQMAIGFYLAFVMLVGTIAGITYFAEGINYCDELKFAVSAEKLFPISWEL